MGHSETKFSLQSTSSTIGDLLSDFDETKVKKIRKVAKYNQKAAWNRAETEQLKKLINVYGSDFSLIAQFMKKTRDQIKRRFKYLEKKDLSDVIFDSKMVDETE